MSLFRTAWGVSSWFLAGPRTTLQSIRSGGLDTDMEAKLAERFKASKGSPIEFDGHLVHMTYELAPIEIGTELRVEFRKSSPSRPQALRLKARGGRLSLNDQILDDVVLWSDTAPRAVDAVLVPESEGRPMFLLVWNAWRDEAGTMHAWIGNAGMVVEQGTDGTVILHCSDGYGEPNFDDLQIRLTLRRSANRTGNATSGKS